MVEAIIQGAVCQAQEQLGENNMSELKICIVEDEDFVRESVVQLLNIKGYDHILEASRGQEAIAMIEKEKPDIVFLDIRLADNINGIEVLKRSRGTSPNTKFVMMSAYQDEFGKQTKDLGAYGFLKKPITKADTLINIIKEISDKK
jgi:YesN/AraC family two-component response regulator